MFQSFILFTANDQLLKPAAIIVGSGIAGIAAAIRLAKKGYAVDVFEANDYAGGKIHALSDQGYRFDMGPSLFTMPHLVDELFELHDMEPKLHFNYDRKEIICNYFWEDGNDIFSSQQYGAVH